MNTKSARVFIISLVWLLNGVLCPDSVFSSGVQTEKISIQGLYQPVEIIRDRWGIAHIFAQNQKDLFFAQGFNVARDRLFQLEIWRRQATGTLAEILGPQVLKQDTGARLLKARVAIKKEMAHYHPDGEEIITAFVRGINAYIDLTKKEPDLLPLEFNLLGIVPGHWTPEVVVSRHNGLFRNAEDEVAIAQSVHFMGAEKVQELLNLQPGHADLKPENGVDLSQISEKILELYTASRGSVRFTPENIVSPDLRLESSISLWPQLFPPLSEQLAFYSCLGSNNWVVKGNRTQTGYPFMANDPHRRQQVPSLRYWVHLSAPGWNVIGGGEPALPGVSIGHNESGAWGLTIFAVDQEDLYVYDTNPSNPNQYRFKGNWEDMKIIKESIPVKGQSPVSVELKYTRHGPVLFEDKSRKKAYALRAAWLEAGGAPYLASLRMDQAETWEEFREACSYSQTPSENMVWADRKGNIGWQAVGITPLRKNWKGLLPVSGNGLYEWEGFLPIKELPHIYNPSEGFFATANQYNLPKGYPVPVGQLWSDPFRHDRIQEVLSSNRKFSVLDMVELQQDVLSVPARSLVPLLKGLRSPDAQVQRAIDRLLAWDFILSPESVEAAIYVSWEKHLSENVWNLFIPEKVRKVFPRRSLKKMIEFLAFPDSRFGSNPKAARNKLLLQSLEEGISDLRNRLGQNWDRWQYGQKKFHHIKIQHVLSDAVNKELRDRLDIGPLPRGGNGYTVNNTSSGFNQTSGASFRIIADLSDWDNSVGTNSPGQSGNPESPHYKDLFQIWARGEYFPVFFSQSKIESSAELVTLLEPIE